MIQLWRFRWAFVLAAAAFGFLVLFAGFAYLVMNAGIPYQDPTPEQTANYAFHSRIGGGIALTGFVTFAAGLAGICLCGAMALVRRWHSPSRV